MNMSFITLLSRRSIACASLVAAARALSASSSSSKIGALQESARIIQSKLLQNPVPPTNLELWNDYHEIAQEMLENKCYTQAEDCFRFSLNQHDNNPAVRERLSATLREAGRLLEAANELHTVIKDLPGPPDVRAWLYLDLGHLLERISPLPNSGPDWDVDRIAPSLVVGGDESETLTAIDCYRRAVDLDPVNGEARKRLGDALAILEHHEEALEEFQMAAKLLPTDICCATHVRYTDPKRSMPIPPIIPRPGGSVSTPPQLHLKDLYCTIDDIDETSKDFERDGVIVLPSFLSDEECQTLAAYVQDTLDSIDDNDDNEDDFTMETREASFRLHCALSVNRCSTVLDNVCSRLWPVLNKILQADDGAIPLLGWGFMRVDPGAASQELHKDVHHYDRHNSIGVLPESSTNSRTVSIQLQLTDTNIAEPTVMGSLEVLPGSHRPDAAAGQPDTIRNGLQNNSGVIPICVPQGTVTIYSSRLWHRGGANDDTSSPDQSSRSRTFCFMTVTEPNAPAPPGLIHTMTMEDVGKWHVTSQGLREMR